MKYFFSLLLLLFVVSACSSPTSTEPVETEPAPLLRHVVLFNLADSASTEKVKEIETAFAALPNEIEEIHAFEWGINNSPEGLHKGLDHCFLITFLSEADRDAYLPHPAHLAFVDLAQNYIEDVVVVDYWTK